MTSDPEAGKQRMVDSAAGQGVTLTTEEVHGFAPNGCDEEFDDIELDASLGGDFRGGRQRRC